jgi:hypothetical protein
MTHRTSTRIMDSFWFTTMEILTPDLFSFRKVLERLNKETNYMYHSSATINAENFVTWNNWKSAGKSKKLKKNLKNPISADSNKMSIVDNQFVLDDNQSLASFHSNELINKQDRDNPNVDSTSRLNYVDRMKIVNEMRKSCFLEKFREQHNNFEHTMQNRGYTDSLVRVSSLISPDFYKSKTEAVLNLDTESSFFSNPYLVKFLRILVCVL